MSLPSTNGKTGQQASIRSFFTPKQPAYVPPPSSSSYQQRPAAPPPPPLPSATAATISPPLPSPPNASETNGAPSEIPPAALPRPASLHPQATISPILPEHIPALRRITSLLLPVNYPDSFWARLSDPQSSGAFSRVLLWTDGEPSSSNDPSQLQSQPQSPQPKVIGGLVCRPEPSPFPLQPPNAYQQQQQQSSSNALYIQSLVLLSPYRSLGLAAALLDDVARAAALSPLWACDVVWAHVWTDNADGLRWYLARGFEREPGEIAGYYFKLRPDSAWIVKRRIDGGGRGDAGITNGNENGITGGGDMTSTSTIPPSTTAAAANLAPPPPPPSTSRPGPSPNPRAGSGSGMSYQNARPQTEWNDLPADMHVSRSGSSTSLAVPAGNGNNGGGGSGASSRSSSAVGRKKKDRAYPAAAFGK